MSNQGDDECVLDSSGLLAVVRKEPGYEIVVEAMKLDPRPRVSSVNLAEIVTKLADWGYPESEIRALVNGLRVQVVRFDAELAYATGLLRPLTKSAGLSLGDRACIALATQLGARIITMDAAWATLSLPVPVLVARPHRGATSQP